MNKLKLGELELVAQAVSRLLYGRNQDGQMTRLPFSVTYRLTAALESLQKGLAFFYQEKERLLQDYAETGEDGEILKMQQTDGSYTVTLKQDCMETFQTALQELCEVESDIETSPVDGLFQALLERDVELDAMEVMALRHYFKECEQQ